MMATKRGIIWRILHTSSAMRILLYLFLFALFLTVYAVIFHTIYPPLEGRPTSWPESFLFVIQTITTTGSLIQYHTESMILFTSVMMITGVLMLFMVIPLILTPYLVAVLRPTPPQRTPHRLSRHTVIIGYGELTRSLLDSLAIVDREILIIEKDENKARELAKERRRQAYVIWGQYDDPQTWEQAWIRDAGYVIINEDERTAASIILGMRERTKAQIIAAVDKIAFDRYLRYAGADYVLSPKHATGRILARHAVLNPGGDTAPEIPGLDRLTISSLNGSGKDLRLIHIPVDTGCRAIGKTIGELRLFERFGILILCLWKAGMFVSHPADKEMIDGTTSLFLFGRAPAIESAIREEFKMDGKAKSHAIIAGFGDVGSAAYQEMIASGTPCVVIDAKRYEVNEVLGNAEDEEVLKQARVGEAQFCIIALNNDDVNIFTTLMARNLNPGIRILARANEPASVEKLYRAGADYVALLPMIGGQTIGRIVLSDTVTILLNLPDGEMVVEKRVRSLHPETVGHITKHSGIRIIGIEADDHVIVSPPSDEPLHEGESVIAVGDTERLKRFIRHI
jgi:Trk K+ transport system NAD-binding subunit